MVLLCLSFTCSGQKEISNATSDVAQFKAEKLLDVDRFGSFYFSMKNNTIIKKSSDTLIKYANFQLGEIDRLNAFNPLKLNLFYRDFNTVVLLDNRLAEITKIDFNQGEDFKNVSLVSPASDNAFWLFNQDEQRLELFEYLNRKTKLVTQPVKSNALDLVSDYNSCILLTENNIHFYNYFGSMLKKIPNNGYTELAYSDGILILKKENQLYRLNSETNDITSVASPDFLINQFLVTNETLYIYSRDKLIEYQL
ncbi:hypothetical protein Q2T40_20540 [Winogradskyella maritima]|nr:hypothetical protein [Winogradskyella maritima]